MPARKNLTKRIHRLMQDEASSSETEVSSEPFPNASLQEGEWSEPLVRLQERQTFAQEGNRHLTMCRKDGKSLSLKR